MEKLVIPQGEPLMESDISVAINGAKEPIFSIALPIDGCLYAFNVRNKPAMNKADNTLFFYTTDDMRVWLKLPDLKVIQVKDSDDSILYKNGR